jgi:pyruvate/2-oxoglutarate dehydrogenase complex dihydrolipoamide dehydrogenase (E3) component
MSAREFDVIVIGAGPAGEIAAARLAQKGARRVAIVDEHLVGGECSFYACMPSKALLRAQELLREVGRVPGAPEAVTGSLDVPAVLARRDEVIGHLDDCGQLPWLADRGVELIRGHAHLAGERAVEVDGQLLQAREAVILAVGSGALIPPIPGLADVAAWSNRKITTAREVPRRLLVLGGGVVGVEMAQAWNSLGSQVTIVEAMDSLLGREEPFAGQQLAEAFAELGIEVHLGVRAAGADRRDGNVALTLQGGGRVEGDRLLVAIGRHPRTDELGLETVGLTSGRHVEVDEHLRVAGSDWLYAVGDVNGRALLTHMGKYQARIAADHILGENARLVSDGAASPRVVFTDPQVAAVGHTLDSARKEGIAARAIDLPTSGTAGASFYGRGASGTTRFVIDTEREVLLGATFVGAEVADFLHAATIAVIGQVPLARLAHAIPAFPTRSELWLKLMEAYGEHYISQADTYEPASPAGR